MDREFEDDDEFQFPFDFRYKIRMLSFHLCLISNYMKSVAMSITKFIAEKRYKTVENISELNLAFYTCLIE